jgi:hypothetical protein
MAEAREQINPKVTSTTKALLLRYCQERHTTQGDVVDAALQAFFQPQADEELVAAQVAQMGLLQAIDERLQVIEGKQDSLEQGVAALVPLLTTMVERLEKPLPEPEPPPPIAEYADLYPQLRTGLQQAEDAADRAAQPDNASDAPPPARRHWFFTRRTAS